MTRTIDPRMPLQGLCTVSNLVLLAGCSTAPPPKTAAMAQLETAVTRYELRLLVYDYAGYFSAVVGDAADTIIEAEEDPDVDKAALRFKIHAIPAMQKAVFQSDPLAGLADAWALSVQMLWPDLHIDPEQAIEARVALGSGLFIPVHWGTFNLAMHAWTEPVERVLVAAEKAGAPIAVPRPGESIEPASPPRLTHWWPSVPWQTVEESPVGSSGIEQPRAPHQTGRRSVE